MIRGTLLVLLAAWVGVAYLCLHQLGRVGAKLPVGYRLDLVLWAVPTWLIRGLLVKGPLWLLGWPVCLIGAFSLIERESQVYPGRRGKQFRRVFWLWCNEEDDVTGLRNGDPLQRWWQAKTGRWSAWWRILIWSAWRNAVNNLRYVRWLNVRPQPARIRWVGTGDEPPDGKSGWAYCWQGLYRGLYVKTPQRWLWIGWKFKPSDEHGIPVFDTRLPLLDFATQWQRVSA